MGRKNQNKLILGDYNAICDICKWKFKASDLRKRWDNLMVCEKDWEPRHPQDFIRAIPDMQALPWTRPEVSDNFESTTFTTLSGEDNSIIASPTKDKPLHKIKMVYPTAGDYLEGTVSLEAKSIWTNPYITFSSVSFYYYTTDINSPTLIGTTTISDTTSFDSTYSWSGSGLATGTQIYIYAVATDSNNDKHYTEIIPCTTYSDPYFAYVQLLLHFDGNFTDSSQNAISPTTVGSPVTSSSIYEFGSGSWQGDDTLLSSSKYTEYVGNANFTLDTQYTIEFSAYLTSLSTSAISNAYVMMMYKAPPTGYNDQIYYTVAGGNLNSLVANIDGHTVTLENAASLATGVWRQYAVTRDSSGNIYVFRDGTLLSTTTGTTPSTRTGNPDVWLPANTSGYYGSPAYIDEFRFTNGVCRYTTDYTTATRHFPNG